MVDGTSGDDRATTHAAATPAVVTGGSRWPMSLIGLGVVLFLLSIAGWWAQDVLGTLANEGEADIGETVTFASDGGRYRLVSSGPLRPDVGATYCDLTYADGSTRREVGGQGLQAARLGVDRLLSFEPPAGETSVRCTSRGSDVTGNGRFQVLDDDGPVRWALIGTIVLALASLAVGIGTTVRAVRRGGGPDLGSMVPEGVFGQGAGSGRPDRGGTDRDGPDRPGPTISAN